MALGLAACTTIESRDLIREGNQAYRDGNYEEAIEKYNQSLEIEPDGVTVLWNRAMAAESIVLQLKDATDEQQIEVRNQYATLALESLEAWNERREKTGVQEEGPECAKSSGPTPEPEAEAEQEAAEAEGGEDEGDPDTAAYEQHRLAILGADARCDDLIEHWLQMHKACPQNEDLYMTIAQTFEDTCGKPDKAEEWYVKRTEDFPDSPKAWYSLATRRFFPLMPEEGMQFNPNIDSTKRLEIANEVINLLEKATVLDGQYRDPYVWRSMAYKQRQLAREYIDPPETPEDGIQAILARQDSMLAWRETKAVCDIDKIPDCPYDPEAGELFRDLETDPGSWKDRELTLSGNVVNDSVEEVDAGELVYEFDLEVEYVPPPPVPEEGEDSGEPPPPPDPEAEPLTRMVKVRHTFLKPVAEEGEEAPDISAEIEAQLDVWKRLKVATFSGFIQGEGDQLTLVSTQKQFVGCCPPAPLTPDDERADAERLKELRAEQKAAQEAAEEAAKKGRKR